MRPLNSGRPVTPKPLADLTVIPAVEMTQPIRFGALSDAQRSAIHNRTSDIVVYGDIQYPGSRPIRFRFRGNGYPANAGGLTLEGSSSGY